MLLLESLKCDYCHKQCQFNPIKEALSSYWSVVVCQNSGQLKCSQCRISSDRRCGQCKETGCFLLPHEIIVATMLATIACSYETKRLDFGIWNPFLCGICGIPVEYNGERALCFDGNSICCSKCSTCRENPLLKARLTAIMKELHSHFGERGYVPVKRTDSFDKWWENTIGNILRCSSCESTIDLKITENGSLLCSRCSETTNETSNSPWTARQQHWSILSDCFPRTSELKLLSYSKWTPFRCPICSVPFSENSDDYPIFHYNSNNRSDNTFCCSKCHHIKKCSCNETSQMAPTKFLLQLANQFKILFKDEGTERAIQCDYKKNVLNKETQSDEQLGDKLPLIDEETQWEEQLQESQTTEKETKNKRTQIPGTRTERCSCGIEDKVEDIYRCVPCSMSVVCCRCAIKHHADHKLINMLGEQIQHFILADQQKQFAKLDHWQKTFNQLDVQIFAAKKQLMNHLRVAFQQASTSEELELVENILAKTDITSLIYAWKEARNIREKLTKDVETRIQSMPAADVQNEPALSKRKLRISRRASCLCGTEDEFEELYQCVRCLIPDVCSRCAMKFHKGHQFVDMLGEHITNVVSVEQKEQLAKLNNWNISLNRLDGQVEASMQELRKLHQEAYQKASASEDPRLVERILANCDVQSLMDAMKILRTARKRFTRIALKQLRSITNEIDWSDEDLRH